MGAPKTGEPGEEGGDHGDSATTATPSEVPCPPRRLRGRGGVYRFPGLGSGVPALPLV